jgi:hypothetical protein
MPDFPPPDATRAEIDAFYAKHAPPPEPAHEVPATEGGPSLMCNGCGLVRVGVFNPLCKQCKSSLEG